MEEASKECGQSSQSNSEGKPKTCIGIICPDYESLGMPEAVLVRKGQAGISGPWIAPNRQIFSMNHCITAPLHFQLESSVGESGPTPLVTPFLQSLTTLYVWGAECLPQRTFQTCADSPCNFRTVHNHGFKAGCPRIYNVQCNCSIPGRGQSRICLNTSSKGVSRKPPVERHAGSLLIIRLHGIR